MNFMEIEFTQWRVFLGVSQTFAVGYVTEMTIAMLHTISGSDGFVNAS